MRRLGPNKTALHFRRKKQLNNADQVDNSQHDSHSGMAAPSPKDILRALYIRYQRQVRRWQHYRNLFAFLAFVGLFLGVLYSQRNAHVAYNVHSTLSSVVLPEDSTMQDRGAVYDWVQGLLEEVWEDPVCGDGICESPFEFASYGRFGCRADCGRLTEVQNLTTLQLDIYYDFTHPIGSMSSADLMQQASWNLCPQETDYASDCYFDQDITFDRISGEQHYVMDDAPDGQWTLVVKRDTFNKVQGAVRDAIKVGTAAVYHKLAVAMLAARAEQRYELELLEEAVNITSLPLFGYIWSMWVHENTTSTRDAHDLSQLKAASCACPEGAVPLVNTTGFDNSTYFNENCTGVGLLERRWSGVPYNYTAGFTVAPPADVSAYCQNWVRNLTAWRTNVTSTIGDLLVNKRVGNRRSTGKFAFRATVRNTLAAYLGGRAPELVEPVFLTPSGDDPIGSPVTCRLDSLIDMYVLSPKYSLEVQRADLAIGSRSRLVNVSLPELGRRARSRMEEVLEQQKIVEDLIVYGPLGNFTLGKIYDNYVAAGANTTYLPSTNASALWPLNVTYNLAVWPGSTIAYMSCNLASREASYIGSCQDMPVRCVGSLNDSVPFTCTKIADSSTVQGNISDLSYRIECELPCEYQQDCNTLCECYQACSTQQVCVCPACNSLSPDAFRDPEFLSINESVANPTVVIADVAHAGVRRRSLLQTNTTNVLEQVLGRVAELQQVQGSLSGQINTLKSSVDQANQLAELRARDTTVRDLIKSSYDTLVLGQKRVEDKLDTIIGKQQAALELAQTAAKTLDAINELQVKQSEALAALDKAIQAQLLSIKVATSQNIISLSQALLLWKRARRDRALATKTSRLATIPCTTTPTVDNLFRLDNGNIAPMDTARERTIGLTNRVIAGLLLHTWRTRDQRCPQTRFNNIQAMCTGELDFHPYGVDPVFKRGTSLYDPDLDDGGTLVLGFYNCSELVNPHYNMFCPQINSTANSEPFCAELYNCQDLPFAFHHFPLKGHEDGFPVWLDINLSQEQALQWFTYLSEGLFLDMHTKGLLAEMVTYNAELKVFGFIQIKFTFTDGGSIKVTHRIHTLRVELYQDREDQARYAFEIILAIAIFGQLLWQLFQMCRSARSPEGLKRWVSTGWNRLELASNLLMSICVIIWYVFAFQYAGKFAMDLRYDVYKDLQADAHYLDLQDDGKNLITANSALQELSRLINLLNWYYALQGINILLLIVRVLTLMDFQPRLGVVTRALATAGPDLVHFALVCGVVFVGYSMMAYLIFGNSISAFSTFGTSINTCFEILLGAIDVNTDLRALGGLQSLAGTLFFWSFELLVFMVLLNFLLAIIVDAFSEVKERTHENTGVHTEVLAMMRERWRALVGRITRNYISEAKLGALLQQWSGAQEDSPEVEEEEEGQKTGREDVMEADVDDDAKKILVGGHLVDVQTLKEVFMGCMLPEASDQHGPKEVEPQASGCWPQRTTQGPLVPSLEEVEQAARTIVSRFGIRPAATVNGEEDMIAGPDGDLSQQVVQERGRLATALEQLADVQRQLAEAQHKLMAGQKTLAENQARLVSLLTGPLPPDGQPQNRQ